ncbi:alpha-fetoprotein [Striga asiatica]|uniref:Alpha-fetoprotein n=1 Tax=Striga asiatica TaxID=4170 RepID=A0A5A7QNV7_STRAF|nr:alpha-fetoprotein [Striga asiatica]
MNPNTLIPDTNPTVSLATSTSPALFQAATVVISDPQQRPTTRPALPVAPPSKLDLTASTHTQANLLESENYNSNMVKTRNAGPSMSKDKGTAITVAPPESSNHSNSDSEDETTPLARTHGIPFLVFNDSEVAAYKRLAAHTMPNPRAIEWATMKALHIDERVRSYLKVLNLEKYATRDNFTAFRTLTLECFSTIEMHDNGNYLTCRLDGKEVKITDKVLCDIYGLKTTGARKKPGDFQTDRHWASFSPCKTFHKIGPSAGLIKELPIAVVHKFLPYHIFEKKEANKVSEQEVFVLWAMCEKKPICLLNFLKRRHTPKNTVEEGIGPMGIGYIKLKSGGFLDRHFKFQPYTERKCYKAYVKEMKRAAAEATLSTQDTGGPSQQAADEIADPIEHTPGDEEEPAQLQSHHGIPDALFEQAPKWFVEHQKRQDEYQTRQEEYLRTIHAEVSSHNARLEAYIAKNDKRWDQWEETHETHEARWDHWEQKQYAQWNQWND